jgi:hypothetical protein
MVALHVMRSLAFKQQRAGLGRRSFISPDKLISQENYRTRPKTWPCGCRNQERWNRTRLCRIWPCPIRMPVILPLTFIRRTEFPAVLRSRIKRSHSLRYAIWLFCCAACSLSVVIQDGDILERLCSPVLAIEPIPPSPGSKRFMRPRISVVVPGAIPCNNVANLAGKESTSSAFRIMGALAMSRRLVVRLSREWEVWR